MLYPTLTELGTSRQAIDVFGGYNHNLRIGEGEFYDMTNLTSADYPVLSPRPQRGVYATPDSPQGLISKDALCYVDGEDFVINERRVHAGLSTRAEDCPKSLISMGAYVIIMPDKKYIDTANFESQTEFSIEASIETSSDTSFTLCKIDGAEYEDAVVSSTAPKDPKNLDLWLDTSSTPNVLKIYAETTEMWTSVATTYIKISSPGIGKPFAVGDGVTISGITVEDLADLNNTMVIWGKGDDHIIVTGILTYVATQEGAIKVERRMPNMDFVIESGNRLWGCRYGIALNGSVVNEIYASKLGDFKNWHCFAGISTDSYVASVGTDGVFTGAVTHLGYPLFFKENCVHKVYGNYPANYQIQTTTCRGVQKGCHKSLAIVNETLFYKSRSAVCAYDGSLPSEISSALGDVVYDNAVAGVLGNKYYISMQDVQGEYSLFVFDTAKGMWHREDNTQVADFCNCRGDLYYIDYADKHIKTVLGTGDKDTSMVKWRAVTGFIGTENPDKKYVSRIVARLSLEVGATVVFSIEYDSSGEWEHLFTKSGTKLGSISIPVRTRRCDHFRLRIEGVGMVKIFSIVKTVEQGSDV